MGPGDKGYREEIWEWDLPSQISGLGKRIFSYMDQSRAINITQNGPLCLFLLAPPCLHSSFSKPCLHRLAMQDMPLTCGCKRAVSDSRLLVYFSVRLLMFIK